jgi:hypothetical protein
MSLRERISIHEMDPNICVNFWDPTTKTIVATEENEWKAANKLGKTHRQVRGLINRKERVFHPGLKMEVAVRFGIKNKETENAKKATVH